MFHRQFISGYESSLSMLIWLFLVNLLKNKTAFKAYTMKRTPIIHTYIHTYIHFTIISEDQ